MAHTGQTEVDAARAILQEVDPANSRLTDPQILVYINKGRRWFAVESEAVKGLFERTLTVGPTVLGGNVYARYPLDSLTIELDAARYDGRKLRIIGEAEYDFNLYGALPTSNGVPAAIVRRGAAIDVCPPPSEAKVLQYLASVLPAPLALATAESELTDEMVDVAVDAAVGMILEDDDRDGSIPRARAVAAARKLRFRLRRPGASFVQRSDP